MDIFDFILIFPVAEASELFHVDGFYGGTGVWYYYFPVAVPPPFPRKQRPPGAARSRPGRAAAKRTLDGEDRSGIMRGEGKKRSAPLLQDFNRYPNSLGRAMG